MMVNDNDLKDAICNSDIEYLTKNKKIFNINHRFKDEDNDTLLLYALSDDGSDSYKFFLENDADVSLVNDHSENVIHSAIYSGDLKRLIYILEKTKIDVNLSSDDGTTPLLLSVLLGKNDLFKELLSHGADINKADKSGNRPIHVACSEGNLELVTELVNNNVDLKGKTVKGNYPFALAVNSDRIEVVKFLYKKIYKE